MRGAQKCPSRKQLPRVQCAGSADPLTAPQMFRLSSFARLVRTSSFSAQPYLVCVSRTWCIRRQTLAPRTAIAHILSKHRRALCPSRSILARRFGACCARRLRAALTAATQYSTMSKALVTKPAPAFAADALVGEEFKKIKLSDYKVRCALGPA